MKRFFWLIVFFVAVVESRAQFDVSFTNYWGLESFYNPAAAGVNKLLDIHGAYSMQMAGFEDAPNTMLISGDLPLFFLNPKNGAGLGFMNDAEGLFSNKKIWLQYAFHQPLGKKKNVKLSFGLRVAMLYETFKGTELDVETSGDKAFPTSDVNGIGLDIDFGLRFSYKDIWYVGLSGMHLTSPTVTLGDTKANEVNITPSAYVLGGYTYKFRNPMYSLKANGMVMTDLQTVRGDVTARLCYDGPKHKLFGGLTYSPTISVGFLLGMNFHGVNICYSYELYTGGVGMKNGTHEVILGYEMDLSKMKKGRNIHKSVRFL